MHVVRCLFRGHKDTAENAESLVKTCAHAIHRDYKNEL